MHCLGLSNATNSPLRPTDNIVVARTQQRPRPGHRFPIPVQSAAFAFLSFLFLPNSDKTMAANNKAVIRLIAFLCLLTLLCLSLAPPVMGGNPEEVEKDQKTSSKKRKGAVPVVEKDDGASDDEAKDTPTTTSKPVPTETPANCPESEALNNGFGAGSIFVAILFGMGLMFALGQLYTFWEKRRLNDSPNYRGY